MNTDDIIKVLNDKGKVIAIRTDTVYGLVCNALDELAVNKIYDITNIHDVNSVVVYYVSKYNDNTYYVPLTMYVNDNTDKIKIVVDKFKETPLYKTNLMSYLNNNAELLSIDEVSNELKLEFNNYIFSDFDTKDIESEVINTISLSIKDNYDVDSYSIIVNNEEIYKKVLNSF